MYHGNKLAQEAKIQFVNQFSKKELPSDLKSVSVKSGKYQVADLLLQLKLVESKSEARRLLSQNGIKINQQPYNQAEIEIKQKNNLVVQVGKRKFVRIK